jgi:HD-GYP domain-containing protein (c-di-GMP phosphodiesterase class II)
MTDTDSTGAKQCVERILLELEGTAAGPISCVSASGGVVTWQRPQTAEALLEVARRGIERARADGGGRTAVMSSGLDDVGPEDDTRRDAIVGLATTLLERDRYTGDHSEAVVRLTVRVAEALALNPDEVARVETAALLHDVGKVGIPDSILRKAGTLTEEEFDQMRLAPVAGAELVGRVEGLGPIVPWIYHAHEHMDGSGYPEGLRGDVIPLASRIIAVADAFDAMTTNRPYRAALSREDALSELHRCSGSQFDPECVDALERSADVIEGELAAEALESNGAEPRWG